MQFVPMLVLSFSVGSEPENNQNWGVSPVLFEKPIYNFDQKHYWHVYQQDPVFAQVVDLLTKLIEQCQLSPYEIRQAAMFAVLKYEENKPFAECVSPKWASLLKPQLQK